MNKPHIVIVGAGFGGTYTAQALMPYVSKGLIDVTVINKTNYFLFTPLLHEVATGGLSSLSVTEPLREIFSGSGIRFHQGTVESLDSDTHTIRIDGVYMTYDYAVIATGAITNYYGISGAQEYSLVLKNLSDAVAIRERIIDAFEDAAWKEDAGERKHNLSFVVVGGGATGVEMAAEMAEFITEMGKRHFYGASAIKPEDVSIHLANTGVDVLVQMDPVLRAKASKHLKRLGVVLHMGMTVSEVTDSEIIFSDGTSIKTHTVLWTAGITPLTPTFLGNAPTCVVGKISTDEFLRVKSDNGVSTHVFALGDVSCVETADNRGYPPVAQVASAQADIVSRNIIASIQKKPLTAFKYVSKGTLVSLGQWYAVGTIFGMHLSGRFMWWVWRTVYVFKFNSWSKRFQILSEWTQNLFFPRDITKLY
jgi:NADH dehydrogenase